MRRTELCGLPRVLPRVLLVVLVLVLSGVVAAEAACGWQARWEESFRAKKLSEAANVCLDTLRSDASNLTAFEALGETVNAAAARGKLDPVREAVAAAATGLSGGRTLPILLQALVASAGGKFELSAKLLAEAEGLAPGDARVYGVKAELLLRQQAWDAAEKAIRTALEIDPFSVDARLSNVRLLIARKQFTSAQEQLTDVTARTRLSRPSVRELAAVIETGMKETGQGVLRGICTLGASGQPVEGAVVQAVNWVAFRRGRGEPRDDGPYLSAVTGKTGEFIIRDVPLGTYVVKAYFKGLVVDSSTNVRLAKDTPMRPLKLRLTEGGDLDVVVQDEDSGKPVVMADVAVTGRRESDLNTLTGASGVASFKGLFIGTYTVSVEAPGYVGRKSWVSFVSGTGEKSRRVTVALKKAVFVDVQVLGSGGQPLKDALVQVLTKTNQRHFRYLKPLTTGASGQVRIDVMHAGEEFRLLAYKPGDGYAMSDLLSGPGGAVIRPVLRLPAPLAVGGVVRDGAGRPVAGATVYAKLFTKAPVPRELTVFSTSSDPAGKFRFSVCNTGEYGFKAEKAGYVADGLKRLQIDGATDACMLDLLRAQSISGVVVDADGRPVAGAFVYALNYNGLYARSDEKGRFSLRGLLRGKYNLYIVHKEFKTLTRKGIKSGSADVRFVVTKE